MKTADHHPADRRARAEGAAAAWFRQATAFHREGRTREAASLYEAVLKADRGHKGALHYLGLIRMAEGLLEEAVRLFRRALNQDPGFAEAHNSLGGALKFLGRDEEALARFQKAAALAPDYAEAQSNLGTLLQQLGRPGESAAHFDQAIRLKPEFAEAHAGRAVTLEQLGRLDEALAAIETAIRLDPKQPKFYRVLGALRAFAPGEPHIAALEALAGAERGLDDQARIELHFAFGKAYADIGERERGFRHLIEGNRLARQKAVYDEPRVLAALDAARALFTPEFLAARQGGGDPSPAPVFVIGLPRSGTTLVEQILSGHANLAAAGERDFLHREVHAALGGAEFPGGVAGLDRAAFGRLGRAYAARLRALAPDAMRITDKTPGNLPYAGLIALALPNARIVQVRRDPVDIGLSCFAQLFDGGQQPFSYELGELGRFCRVNGSLMDHWRAVLEPARLLELRYEELVEDLPGQARRLVAHCGLDWDERCLEFHRVARPVRTASAAQVRRPIYRSSVGRGRALGTLLQPLLDGLAG